jgi:hypothetical protein
VRLVAVEEHFWSREVARATGARHPAAHAVSALEARLEDLGDERLAAMDRAGIGVQVISHTAPGVQPLDPQAAVPLARRANDELAAAIRRRPDRLAGLATLPTPAPGAAAEEFERAVADLGFVGAIVHGQTGGRFLDAPEFEPILACAERIGVPLYVHPAEPVAPVRRAYFEGFPPGVSWKLAGPAWGWHAEAGLHVLRMILAGVFERHPRLQVLAGHMGEMLPFMLDRLDEQLPARLTGLAREPSSYVLSHVHVTTSGRFGDAALACALSALGADRVLFAVDWPYSSAEDARARFDAMPLAPDVRAHVGRVNAEKLFRMPVRQCADNHHQMAAEAVGLPASPVRS